MAFPTEIIPGSGRRAAAAPALIAMREVLGLL